MRWFLRTPRILIASCAVVGFAFWPAPASAHCDGMDGPVVKAAQEALAKGDVNLVLIWVRMNDEAEIRAAFDRTVNVRKLGPQAKEVAEMYFFETLVRLHRAAEGAPFTGIKPAGRDLGPAIPAADAALESGNLAPLITLLLEPLRAGLFERYQQAMAAKNFKRHDVVAGREYVDKYVSFIHYVEAIYEAASATLEGHYAEGDGSSHREK